MIWSKTSVGISRSQQWNNTLRHLEGTVDVRKKGSVTSLGEKIITWHACDLGNDIAYDFTYYANIWKPDAILRFPRSANNSMSTV